tara:strand:- start:38 stop:760 length:723 start_codon:yes stop_codon:yes gene_type:complete
LVSYRQLDQHGIKQVVLHERETTSSGRPKAQSLHQEDADFFYQYDSRGGLISKRSKTQLDKYHYWWERNVVFDQKTKKRITPLSEFEKRMGVKMGIPTFVYKNPNIANRATTHYNEKDWKIFKQTNVIDYGGLEIFYTSDTPTPLGQGKYDWSSYFRKKASEQNLEVVGRITALNFREKQKPAVVEKIPTPAKPKKETVFVAPPDTVEVEPIKEAVKHSPLMIVGVIAVVVILLIKRRGA